MHWSDTEQRDPGKHPGFCSEFRHEIPWPREAWKRMKASKVTDAQRPFVIRQLQDGMSVACVCSKAGNMPAPVFR